MSVLFYLPKVTALPGAKLYFYQTATSTPQDVFTDEDCTVAHSQPVEADGAGVVPPIYLDPTLPHYRVSYYTADDVLVYTVDDVPSNQNTQQSMRLESAAPSLIFYDTDGTANQRKLKVILTPTGLEFLKLNDAESSPTTMRILRWESDIIKSKAFDAARSNNSLLIDSDLQYTFDANVGALYEFDAFLIFRCSSTVPGTSFQFNATTGTCRYVATGSSDAATAATDYLNFATTSNTTIGWAWTNAARHITKVSGYINAPTNGSTFALYWSQTTTNANALTLEAGSFMRLRQVAV